MEKQILEVLKSKDSYLNFTKDRDETLSNYKAHSNSSRGFNTTRRTKFNYRSTDWDSDHDILKPQNKPQLTRVVFRSSRNTADPLSRDLYQKPGEKPFFSTSKYDTSFRGNNSTILNVKSLQNNDNIHQNPQFQSAHHTTDNQAALTRPPSVNSCTTRHSFQRSKSQIQRNFNSTMRTRNESFQMERFKEEQLPSTQKSSSVKRPLFNLKENSSINIDKILAKSPERSKSPEKIVDEEIQSSAPPVAESDIAESEQTIFDEISNQDWFKLIPEEILNNKNIDLDKFFVENSEYFYNLLCQNAQMRSTKPFLCNNGAQNIKLKYTPAFGTTYNSQFFKKQSASTEIPQITDKLMQTRFLGQSQLDYKSQMQKDFIDQGNVEKDPKRTHTPLGQRPFLGLTSYNSTFANWKQYNPTHSKAPNHRSTVDVPLLGKTNYQEQFCSNPNKKGDTAQIHKSNLFKGPIPTYPMFFGETMYSAQFKPFNKQSKQQQFGDQSKAQTIPMFQGQYKTTAQKDYTTQREEDKYSASKLKKVWRAKIIKKLEELRDQRQEQIINAI